MRLDSVKELKGEAFRRLTRVERRTFEEMAGLLFLDDARIWREYRTYFHIGQARGISESAAYRNIKGCENTLAKSKAFRLPGRKAVVAGEQAFDIVLIDASKKPIERPKKTKALLFG